MTRQDNQERTRGERLNEVRLTISKRRRLIIKCTLLLLFTMGLGTYFVTPEFECQEQCLCASGAATNERYWPPPPGLKPLGWGRSAHSPC